MIVFDLLIILLMTIFYIIGNSCFVFLLHFSIQRHQWIDNLLDWQNRLQKWDEEGKVFLAKAGGLCEICFCTWISFVFLPLFLCLFGWLIDILGLHLPWYVLFLWVFETWGLCSVVGLRFVTKLFSKK